MNAVLDSLLDLLLDPFLEPLFVQCLMFNQVFRVLLLTTIWFPKYFGQISGEGIFWSTICSKFGSVYFHFIILHLTILQKAKIFMHFTGYFIWVWDLVIMRP